LGKFARQEKAVDFRAVVIADIDGDGRREIVMSDSRGHLYALDSNGRLRFEVRIGSGQVSPAAVGDVNRDGVPELVLATDDRNLYCVTATGDVLWAAKLDAAAGSKLPLIAGMDKSGRYQVFLSNSAPQLGSALLSLDAATGRLLWAAQTALPSFQSTALADLDVDGRNESVFGDKNTKLNRLDVPRSLHRCLAASNVVDKPHSGVRSRTRRVCRWRASMPARWSAAAFLETEKTFRKTMGYRDL
jgi:outer membrane protein assembly factor BamB